MKLDIYTLIFAALALFLVFKLRSVLGTKTGDEASRDAQPSPEPQAPAPVLLGLPPVVETGYKWKNFAAEGSKVALGLDEIYAKDPSFSPADFLVGAKAAYEMLTIAFAKGDRQNLKPYLSNDVFNGFNDVITGREKNGEKVDYRFIGLDQANIVNAGIDSVENEFEVTIEFVAKAVNATFDKNNTLLDGDADKITEIRDSWVFARKIGSNDPNWLLVGTLDA